MEPVFRVMPKKKRAMKAGSEFQLCDCGQAVMAAGLRLR